MEDKAAVAAVDKLTKSVATVQLKDMKGEKSQTIDSSSSCDDSDTDNATTITASTMAKLPSPQPPMLQHQHSSDILSDDSTADQQLQQSTMWLGTEDGCVHVYNCTDNIRIKKNKTKLQHISAVYSIM